jgi:DNA-binding beta-propeller fold protein YncE
MVFDRVGNVYLVDTDQKANSRVLKLSPDGKKLAEWRVFAYTAGVRNGPEGIAVAHNGDFLVTDAGAGRVLELTPDGRIYGTLGGPKQTFTDLGHIAVDRDGNVYVAQAEPNSIQVFSAEGTLVTTWHRDRGSAADQWGGPESIAVLGGNDLVVEDWHNRRIEILSAQGRTIQIFGRAGRGPGEFVDTAGLYVDSAGRIYVADIALHRIQIFDRNGDLVSSIANTQDHHLFDVGPGGVAVDEFGNFYSPDGLSIVKYSLEGRLLARWR